MVFITNKIYLIRFFYSGKVLINLNNQSDVLNG